MISNFALRHVLNDSSIKDISADLQSAACPFDDRCKGRAQLFSDPFQLIWFSCQRCRRSGSLLQHLQKTRTGTIFGALGMLNSHYGYHDPDPEQRQQSEQRTNLLNATWAASSSIEMYSNSEWFDIQRKWANFSYRNRMVHRDGIDHLIRCIRREQIFETLKEIPSHELKQLKSRLRPSRLWFLARTSRLPGLINGIMIFRYTNRGMIEAVTIPVNAAQDPGYIIHPEFAIANKPTVMTSDFRWFITAKMWSADTTTVLTSIAYCFDEQDMRTQSVQLMRGRSVVYWIPNLTPSVARMAASVDCPVSTFGNDRGSLSRRSLEVPKAGARRSISYSRPSKLDR